MSDEKKNEVEGQGARIKYEPAADVEGQAVRYGKDGEAPEDADVIGEGAGDADEPDVEGQAIKVRLQPAAEVEGQAVKVRFQPAAEVEGQGLRVKVDPEDMAAKPKSGKGEDDHDVEGHPLRH